MEPQQRVLNCVLTGNESDMPVLVSGPRAPKTSPPVPPNPRQATGSGRTCPRGPKQRDTACTMPPTNLTTPFQLHPAAKQLDGQMQPTSLPSSLTGTSHVLSTPTYATKQLDDTVRTSNPAAQPTAEFPPPSSLTVRGSIPADRAQVNCSHWSQQLPTQCHQST